MFKITLLYRPDSSELHKAYRSLSVVKFCFWRSYFFVCNVIWTFQELEQTFVKRLIFQLRKLSRIIQASIIFYPKFFDGSEGAYDTFLSIINLTFSKISKIHSVEVSMRPRLNNIKTLKHLVLSKKFFLLIYFFWKITRFRQKSRLNFSNGWNVSKEKLSDYIEELR